MPDIQPSRDQHKGMTFRPHTQSYRRQTRDGAVIGAASGSAVVWYGIPYAAPPVGALRWRAPQSPEKWAGARDCSRRPAPACQEIAFTGLAPGAPAEGSIIGDEDCLTLTVWTPPQAAAEARLPVMVWFHGGANQAGDGSGVDAARLSASQGVVVVSVNFRLGVLGWLSHRALRNAAATAEERSGNFALLDHIAALRWVRDNIAVFGGDPDRVTIFGHSGGGWNVRALLCSPPARGLFHRAIILSVCSYQLCEPDEAENFAGDTVPGHPQSANELLVSLWMKDGRASRPAKAAAVIRETSDTAIADYLRSKSFADLARAAKAARARNKGGWRSAVVGGNGGRPPQMFADGTVLTNKLQSVVPIIIGTSRFEDRTFICSDRELVRVVMGHPIIRDPDHYRLLSDYLGRNYKLHGVDEPAAWLRSQGARIFAYRFDWEDFALTPGTDYRAMIGAGHGMELPALFGSPDLGGEYDLLRHLYDETPGSSYCRISDAIMSYFAAFAAEGDPASERKGGFPNWPEWTDGEILVFDADDRHGVRVERDRLSRDTIGRAMEEDSRLRNPAVRRRLLRDMGEYQLARTAADQAGARHGGEG